MLRVVFNPHILFYVMYIIYSLKLFLDIFSEKSFVILIVL